MLHVTRTSKLVLAGNATPEAPVASLRSTEVSGEPDVGIA